MMTLLRLEAKRSGAIVAIITGIVVAAFIGIYLGGGDLVNWSVLGFEVIFPILLAILVAELVPTNADPMIDTIHVHAKSLFQWIIARYLVIAGIGALICAASLLLLRFIDLSIPILEILLIFVSTSFFFTSISILASLFSKQAHVPVAICGTLWLLALMARSLTRFPFVAHIYPMLRFVDYQSTIWIANKAILTILGIFAWLFVFITCHRRNRLQAMI